MAEIRKEPRWQIRLIKPRLPWSSAAIRPAEISNGLNEEMFRRENLLEDVNYNKVVPNRYIVELSLDNFTRNYQPILSNILLQWNEHLLGELMTTNSRQGRKEYRLGGRLHIQVRPAEDLKDYEARILSRIQSDMDDQPGTAVQDSSVAVLELAPGGKRFGLNVGITTLGRDATCDIVLDTAQVLEKRLVSKQHAFIRCEPGHCYLYDGSPAGKPSANGTYLNGQQVDAGGKLLQPGDTIILAALDPQHPRTDTPGVILLRYSLAKRA